MWGGALIATIMLAGLGVWRAKRSGRGPSRDGNAGAPYLFADDGRCSPFSTIDCVDSDGGGD